MPSFCSDKLLRFNHSIEAPFTAKHKECIADLTSLLFSAVQSVTCIAILVWVRLYIIRRENTNKPKISNLFNEHTSRWILTFCLISVTLFETAEGLVSLSLLTHPLNNLNILITPLLSLTSSVVTAFYYYDAERHGFLKMLVLLLLYWPCMAIIKISKLLVLYENEYSIQHLRLQLTWSAIILYSLLSGVEVTVLLQEKYVWNVQESQTKVSDGSDVKYRKKYATLFSKATFFWLVPLLRLGYQKPLELEDLGKLPEDESVEFHFEKFNEVFTDEKNKAESKMKKVSLWRCYLRTFWPTLILGAVIKISGDLVGLIGPLSISVILAYVEDVQNGNDMGNGEFITTWEFLQNGFVMAFIALGAIFLQSTFSNNFNHLAIMEGVHLKSALQGLVYRKTLHMSVADMDSGAVVNHMSVDTFNMMMLFSMGHYIWAVPFKIILLLVLLYMQLGYSALIGAATIYVLAPLQYMISSKMSKLQKDSLDISDERLKRTSELIQGIKLLKLYGWESMYGKLIEDVREKELKLLLKDAIYVASNTFITQASSIIVTLVTFGIYTEIEGKNLTPTEVFTGLALFNQLTVPLFIIPFVIPIVINSVVSTSRLQDFLSEHEVESNVPWREMEIPATVEFKPDSGSVLLHIHDREVERLSNPFIFDEADGVFLSDIHASHVFQSGGEGHLTLSIQDGSFSWNPDLRTPALRAINLQITSGKLTAIVGNVGCGKTSLLSAMLGELTVAKGRVKWSSAATSVAYVPQKPWLLNATLKENILFGLPYDGRRYYQVIQACALQPDIDLLPAKDMTEIGERGVNLSGGQRQRVALARAFYSQSRTVILDDPLSALDAHVANHIYDNGIKMLLLRRNRTVIMVTSKVEHLLNAHKIIVLENQRIKYQGTYAEIEKIDPELVHSWKTTLSMSEQVMQQKQYSELTSRERHKLERMFSRQVLFRPASTTDVRRKGRLVSFGRQMSHDPSSPLPCQDCDETDNSWHFSTSTAYNPVSPRVSQGHSSESLQTKSSSSSGVFLRHSWRLPPSRHNSRISGHASDLIEEENEDLDDNDQEKVALKVNNTDKAAGKLMSEEDRERGEISSKVYLGYMHACTLPLALVVVGLIVITQALKVASDFWLSDWSSYTNTSNVTADDISITQYYITGYAAFSLASIILALITNLTAQLTTLKAVRFLHSEMLQNVIRCPMKFFDTTPLGRIINRFSSDMNVIDKKLPVTLPVLLRFIMLCISAIIVDVVVTPYFLVLVIPIFAVYYFIQYFFRFSSRELQRLDSITKSPIFSHFSETLSGLATIRAYHDEKRFTEQLNTYINTNNLAFIMANSSNCWLGVSLDYLGGIILFFATISAMIAAILGHVTPAFVGISMTYTLLVPIYLNWVVRNLASVEMYMNGVERVQAYCKLPVENYQGDLENVIPKDWPTAGEISFEGVTLRYDTVQDPVLRNITLTIKPGEKVGICGRTGTGKSTLVMALFRMVLITEGKIRADGLDIMKLPVAVLRSRISIIPQDTVLFSGTVRDNLDPGRKHTDDELWSVLETAQLKDVIKAQKDGLDAEVTEEGSNFSAGQSQLFCLARALLRKSNILVMDEATASLDTNTDTVLQQVVGEFCQHCTILTIAHRVSSIVGYDRVLVLDAGHIVEDGKPSELMEQRNSFFAQLLKASQ